MVPTLVLSTNVESNRARLAALLQPPHHAPQRAPNARSHGYRAADRRTFSNASPALAHDLGAARKEALSAQQDRPALFTGDHSRGTFGLPRGHGGALEDAVLDRAMQGSLHERRLINGWEHSAALARLYPLETDAHARALMPAYMHACIHAQMRHARTRAQTCMHANTHAQTQYTGMLNINSFKNVWWNQSQGQCNF